MFAGAKARREGRKQSFSKWGIQEHSGLRRRMPICYWGEERGRPHAKEKMNVPVIGSEAFRRLAPLEFSE